MQHMYSYTCGNMIPEQGPETPQFAGRVCVYIYAFACACVIARVDMQCNICIPTRADPGAGTRDAAVCRAEGGRTPQHRIRQDTSVSERGRAETGRTPERGRAPQKEVCTQTRPEREVCTQATPERGRAGRRRHLSLRGRGSQDTSVPTAWGAGKGGAGGGGARGQ